MSRKSEFSGVCRRHFPIGSESSLIRFLFIFLKKQFSGLLFSYEKSFSAKFLDFFDNFFNKLTFCVAFPSQTETINLQNSCGFSPHFHCTYFINELRKSRTGAVSIPDGAKSFDFCRMRTMHAFVFITIL